MRFARWMPWATLLLVAAIGFGVGLRGVYLLVAVLLAWFPALVVAYSIAGTVFPLELRTLKSGEANAVPLTFREIVRKNREPVELNLNDKKRP